MQETVTRQGTRRERRDKGERQMTTRDRWILKWIAEQYAIRFDHLQVLLSCDPRYRNPAKAPGPGGVSDSNVLQILARWAREPEWAQYRKIFVGTPGWITVTPYGLQLLGLDYAPHQLRASTLEHKHWTNCIRLDMSNRHPEYEWTSERTLRAIQGTRRDEGERAGHFPDARLLTQEGRAVAIEVELSPKPDRDLDDILNELLIGDGTSFTYQTVWYFVARSNPVAAQARRAVEAARLRLPEPLQARVQVIELEKLEV